MARNRKRLIPNVHIFGIADKGMSVGKTEEGMIVFVENAVPGDVIDMMTMRKKKGLWFGRTETVHKYSEDRAEPFCEHFGVCGGCKWQHLNYQAQLKHKEIVVHDAFRRIAKVPIGEIQPILGAEKTSHYRNKLIYSFAARKWITQELLDSGEEIDFNFGLGFHKAGAFDKVVDINQCHLQAEPSNEIRNKLRAYTLENEISYHNPRSHEGFMRNLFLRSNRAGEWMLNLIIHKPEMELITPMMDMLIETFPQIKSAYYTVNEKLNDSTDDLDMIHYHGEKYITESLDDVTFRIGPKSFFQTNSYQAEELYRVVKDFANFQGTENVYDLYTGLGSIALYIAKYCKHVVGIEEIAAAIDDANVNKKENNIDNATFYAGDVKNILTDEFAKRHGKPDILITDPPRAGMHAEVVHMLLKLEAPKIVYVSCNPATQARDVKLLAEKYELLKIKPVDMFPHTHHIENVALLQLKK